MKYMKLTRLDGEPIYVRAEALDVFEPRVPGDGWPHSAVTVLLVSGHPFSVKETCAQILSQKWD